MSGCSRGHLRIAHEYTNHPRALDPERADLTYVRVAAVREAVGSKKVVNGYYQVPDTPGLGVELNEDVSKRYDCIVVE